MSTEPNKDLSKAGEKQLCLGCMAPNIEPSHISASNVALPAYLMMRPQYQKSLALLKAMLSVRQQINLES